jgi:hypothetical protein
LLFPTNDGATESHKRRSTAYSLPGEVQPQKETHEMQNVLVNLVIGAAITAVGMFGADSGVGTWKYNAAKSKSTATNPVKSRTDVREETPDGSVKMTRTGELKDGTAVNYSQTFKHDGKEYPVTGAPYDTISSKRINANTTSFETKKTDGKYHVTGRTVVSKDGKTMTQTVKGTDAEGKPTSGKYIYEKQ